MGLSSMPLVVATIALGLGVASAAAQVSSNLAAAPKEVIANGSLLHTLEAAPVLGQPYSAVQVHASHRKLEDGTNLTQAGHHGVARDSSGRVRVEQRLANATDKQSEQILVYVLDPAAHTLTIWRTGGPGEKVAVLLKLPDTKPGDAVPVSDKMSAAEARRPQPIITSESLAPETLDGLPVTVTRTTTIVPVGRSHNDAPITKTDEVWTSPDLKLTLKEQWEDPRTGERTVELKDFSRAEPDPALFRVPPGYKVKDLKQTLQEAQDRLAEMQAAR